MYYWKVSVNDSVANTTAIYHFTTKPQPSTSSPGPGGGYSPPANKYPIANITGPDIGYVGKTVIFCAYYSYDTDGFITGYRWDYNNDGLFDTDWSDDLFTSYVYSSAGNYTVKLQVKDDDGAKSTDSYVINIIKLGVDQHPPVANASGPYEAFVNEDITFNATGSYDPDGTIVLYFWDFGNHNISNLKNPVYSYSKPGDYIAILTVIDNDNLTDSAVATVHIKDNETEGPGDKRERRQPLSCLLFLLIIIIVMIIVMIFLIRNDKFTLPTKSDEHKNKHIKSVTGKSLKKMDKKSYRNIDAKIDKTLSKSDKTKKKK
jgi:PKD repeat protein